MEWLIKTLLAAVISFVVPWLLQRVLPQPAAGHRGADTAPGFPWVTWILGSAIAGGLAGIISGVMGLVLGGVANWAVLGAMLGITQWLVLYRLVDVGPWIALAAALGWAGVPAMAFGHLNWGLAGLLVGLLQWLGLMGKLRGAAWWVPANALAWFAAGMVGLGVGAAVTQSANFALGWIIGWTAVGATGAAVLAVPLGWMWRRTSRQTPSAAAADEPRRGAKA